MSTRSCLPILVAAAVGCSGDGPDALVVDEPAVLRPRIQGAATVEVRAEGAPNVVVTLTQDESGAFSIFTSPAGLATWADEVPALESAAPCPADLDAFGELDAICLTLAPQEVLELELTVVPERSLDVVTWSELLVFESGCIATDESDTVRCTILGPGDRVTPLATVAPPEDPEPDPAPDPGCDFVSVASSNVIDLDTWNDDTLVVVGRFDSIARRYDGLLRFDVEGEVAGCLAGVDDFGNIEDLVEHPDGGYLASGYFESVAGVPCPGLARLDESGLDEEFCALLPPEVEGGFMELDGRVAYLASSSGVIAFDLDRLSVVAQSAPFTMTDSLGFLRDITLHDGVLYVVGGLERVGDEPRPQFAAFDATDLSLLDFAPRFDDRVLTIEGLGGQLWVGGEFTTVDEQPRMGAAIFALPNFTLSPLNLQLDSIIGGEVEDFEPSPDGMWVAGLFTEAAGQPRAGHALFSTTGVLQPDAFPIVDTTVFARLSQIVERDGVVTMAGFFDRVEGLFQENLAAFRRSDGASLPVPPPTFVPRLLPVGDEIWMFTQVAEPARYAATLDVDSGEVRDLQLDLDLLPRGVRVDGDVAYLWGDFTQVAGEDRNGFAAIDLSTLQLLPFAPQFDGEVSTIAVGADRVYVGGIAIPGSDIGTVVAFDKSDGSVIPTFSPGMGGFATELLLVGDDLVVGGFLLTVAGQDRGQLVWVDAETGALRNVQAPITNTVTGLARFGDELIVGSLNAASVTGLPADDGLFAVDLATGTLRNWQPGVAPFNTVRYIVPDGDRILVGGPLRIGGLDGTLFAIDGATASVTPLESPTIGGPQLIRPLGDRLAVYTDFGELAVIEPPGSP